jgi:thiol-disulfide isomerase/thioredoxin
VLEKGAVPAVFNSEELVMSLRFWLQSMRSVSLWAVVLGAVVLAVCQPAAVADGRPDETDNGGSDEQYALGRLKSGGAVVTGNAVAGFHVAIGPKTRPAVIGDLAQLAHLRWLELNADWVADSHLAALRRLSRMELLELASPNIGDQGLQEISHLKQLLHLSLDGLRISDKGLAPVAGLSKLANLTLRRCHNVHGPELKYLATLPRFNAIYLEQNGLTDGAMRNLATIPGLRIVELREEPVTDAAVSALIQIKKLIQIELYDTKMTQEGVAALRRAVPAAFVVRADIALGHAKLRRIGLALEQYHSQNGRLPPAVLVGPDGKTLHSWRVALLPEFGEKQLFAQYRLDQPWNSPTNRKLLSRMPDVYGLPGSVPGSHDAGYFALTGPTAFFSEKPGVATAKPAEDGTVMIVEARRAVPWTKPEDIPYDDARPVPNLGGIHEMGFSALLSNGRPEFLFYAFPFENEEAEDRLRTCLSTSGDEIWKRRIRAKLIAQPVPDFTLPSLAGGPITLSKLIAGKVALIAFSAVGCGPCRVEAAHLTEIYNRHRTNGLVVLTVNGWHEPAELVRKYVQKEKLTQLYVVNGDAVAKEKYHLRSWPMSCWINRHGSVVSVHFGFRPGDEVTLEKEAEELVAAKR